MIKVENIEVNNIEAAIRYIRNTLDNQQASDSKYVYEGKLPKTKEDCIVSLKNNVRFMVGRNDYKLLRTCLKTKSNDCYLMQMITVTMDITAPLYWWIEYDTYNRDSNKIWNDLIVALSSQKMTIKTDFDTLRRIFKEKKDDKIDEWRSFCKIIVDNTANSNYITMYQR